MLQSWQKHTLRRAWDSFLRRSWLSSVPFSAEYSELPPLGLGFFGTRHSLHDTHVQAQIGAPHSAAERSAVG